MRINGTVKYISLAGGFWGIIGFDGQEYRPVNLPKRYQKEGLEVHFSVKEVDEMSIFMWGTTVRILS